MMLGKQELLPCTQPRCPSDLQSNKSHCNHTFLTDARISEMIAKKINPESDAADEANKEKNVDVQPVSRTEFKRKLPGGPNIPIKRKKNNCHCNTEELVQCFPVDSNQNDLKIEVVIPSKLLRKKQRRCGKILIDLNNMERNTRKRSDSIVVDYQDPDTSEVVNIFSIQNGEHFKNKQESSKSKLKQKPFKQLNIVKAKPRINREASVKERKSTTSLSASLESSPRNIVSSTTSLPRQSIFDQIGCEGPDGRFISMNDSNMECESAHVNIQFLLKIYSLVDIFKKIFQFL